MLLVGDKRVRSRQTATKTIVWAKLPKNGVRAAYKSIKGACYHETPLLNIVIGIKGYG